MALVEPGALIDGRFEVEAFVARGGMGDVWRAIDRTTGNRVALKLLSEHSVTHVQRAIREARALRLLEHPAVIGYVAHATDKDIVYLATEWIDGSSLAECLRRGPLATDEALVLAERLATGLGFAHEHGLVHRDVKPSNIMLPGDQARAGRLIDFGIVHAQSWDPLTRTGASIGTPQYMSPEQVRGETVTPASDVFSLGCVLYKALSGESPYRGEQVGAVLAQIAMFEAPPRLAVSDHVPGEVVDLVAHMMSANPVDRPADGRAVAAEIHRARTVLAKRSPGSSLQTDRITRLEMLPVAMVFARIPGDGAEPTRTLTYADTPASDVPSETERDEALVEARRVSPRRLEQARAVCRVFGASVDNVADGAVAAKLVGGASSLDLAVRAARCALALAAQIPTGAIGVSMGRAVLDDHDALRRVVETAVARVPRSGAGIVIDAGIREILPDRFEAEQLESGGFRLYGETSRRARVAEPPRLLLGRETTCVGRNRLLRQLAAAFAGCVEDRAAESMVVIGDAGVGKSRFRAELVGRIESESERLSVVAAWGDPFRSKAPYGLLGRTLRAHLGVPDGDEAAERNQLRAAVRGRVEPDDVERIVEFLGELTGVRFPDETSARLRAARRDPELMADQIRRGFEDWLAAEATNEPVLLVLDDLQWADDASVALLASGLKRCADLPLMVLALGRPEVHDRFPTLGDDWNRQEIVLDALRPGDCERLVTEALGDDVDESVRASIIERSAGNAFYLEELIRSAAAGETERMPESVLASVQLRIGKLPEGARQVLRAASVYGRRFWPAAVGELLEADIDPAEIADWLGLLEREELVLKVSAAAGLAGEAEYVFRHDLTREAAYESLTEEDRETGHRLAGAWLEEAGERDAIVLAEHFAGGGASEQAVEWFEKAAEQALAERDESDALESLRTAARYLLRAAETAAGSYANETAVAFYERGIALLSTIDSSAAARGRLELAVVRERLGQRERGLKELAESLEWIGGDEPALRVEILIKRAHLEMRAQEPGVLDSAGRTAVAARDAASRLGRRDLEARALAALGSVMVLRGSEESSVKALKYAERAYALQADDCHLAAPLWRLGNSFLMQNDLVNARSMYADALASARKDGDQLMQGMCWANIGMVEFRDWEILKAIDAAQQALSCYRRIGHRTHITSQVLNLGTFHQLGGNLERARELLEQALRGAGDDWAVITLSHEGLADLERSAGREAIAQEHLIKAADLCHRVGATDKQALYLGLAAESAWCRGDVSLAIEYLDRAMAVAAVTLSHGLVFAQLGASEDATTLLRSFARIEPDPDRRVLANLALARLSLDAADVESAMSHCQTARALVPPHIDRYALPVRILEFCLLGQARNAVTSLSLAVQRCPAYVVAELIVDVARMLLRLAEPSKESMDEFLVIAAGELPANDGVLACRARYLLGELESRRARPARALELFAAARRSTEKFRSQLPQQYLAYFDGQDWVAEALRQRLVGIGPETQ